MTDCVSAEDGVLVTVSEFVSYLRGVKATPQQVLVAALAGPTTPYVIGSVTDNLAGGGSETHPAVEHTCMLANPADPRKPEYGDPAIRIKQWLDAFPNSVMESICATDFSQSMTEIANAISKTIGAQCVQGDLVLKKDMTTPDCDVTERVTNTSAPDEPVDRSVAFCASGRAGADATHPCWEMVESPRCPTGHLMQICYDVGCTSAAKPSNKTDVLVTCAIASPTP
jgi:hypothetical protein